MDLEISTKKLNISAIMCKNPYCKDYYVLSQECVVNFSITNWKTNYKHDNFVACPDQKKIRVLKTNIKYDKYSNIIRLMEVSDGVVISQVVEWCW